MSKNKIGGNMNIIGYTERILKSFGVKETNHAAGLMTSQKRVNLLHN